MQPHQLLVDSSPKARGAQGPRTAIPLRSILNADDESGPAQNLQVKVESPALEATTGVSSAVQRSQFLFVNSHNASRPSARLRRDQKVINAHVQHASHRQRRAAAMGRPNMSTGLCSSCTLSRSHTRVTTSEHSVSPSSTSPSSSAAECLPASSHANIRARRTVSRTDISGGHTCSQCGIRLSINVAGDDRTVLKSSAEKEKRKSTKGFLSADTFTPLRLYSSQSPTSILDTAVVDPFGTGSVSLTMNMNGVLHHCELYLTSINLLTMYGEKKRTVYPQPPDFLPSLDASVVFLSCTWESKIVLRHGVW